MIVKLLTEHRLEFLSLQGGCRGSPESTLVKLLEISCRGSIINLQAGVDPGFLERGFICIYKGVVGSRC